MVILDVEPKTDQPEKEPEEGDEREREMREENGTREIDWDEERVTATAKEREGERKGEGYALPFQMGGHVLHILVASWEIKTDTQRRTHA